MGELRLDLGWKGLDEAFEALEEECATVIRGISVEMWRFVLGQTPQFYGRMAASWTYSLGQPEFVNRSAEASAFYMATDDLEDGVVPMHKGSPAAIAIANAASAGREKDFRLGDTIWFANGVDHGEGSYSQALEDGEIHLRAANRPGAPARRAADMAQARYYNQVNPQRVEYLKSLKIGG
jgi:hypothetical protein